jgi:hypothetical protein
MECAVFWPNFATHRPYPNLGRSVADLQWRPCCAGFHRILLAYFPGLLPTAFGSH